MGFLSLRSQRYAAYFWACIISCILALSPIAPAQAQNTITWEDLQANTTHLQNPYEHLTTAQTYRLSDFYQLKEWVNANQPEPDSLERKELQRLEESLIAEGIDAAELLKQVESAQAYWSAQSRATNPNITDRPVRLDGYVLPLGADQHGSQTRPMNEFLLVPYVGACIHVPAPPPNQMVYIKTAEAVENPGVFSPVQVEGNLQEAPGSYELFQVDGSRTVDASYKMSLSAIAPTANQPIAAAPTNDSLLTLQGWRNLPTKISNILTTALNRIQNQQSPWAFTLALLLSFSYGVLHTLGPGHGKAVIISYFVGQGGSLQRGLFMGGQIAIFHVLSATLLVILTNTVVRQLGGSPDSNYRAVQLISYGAIALLGGWMLRQTLTAKTTAQPTAQRPNQRTDQTPENLLYPTLSQQLQTSIQPARRTTSLPTDSRQNRQNGWIACSCTACDGASSISGWLALAVGAVPCSGALLVLLYGLANNMLWQSVAMVVAISVGMALTLAWIGIMAIFTHRWSNQMAQQSDIKKSLPLPLAQVGRVIGASCVCLLGISLFALTWMTGT